MNFARKELEKYGWTEGQGLGKTQAGLINPLKPKLKFDNSGLGYDVGAQFTDNWWERLFNKTANNITVESNKDNIKMHVVPPESSNKTSKKDDCNQYSGFLKTSRLTGTTITNYNNNHDEDLNEVPNNFNSLTDEELLAACSGRTAHKGARHGLKQSGKLSRIEKQEKMLLKKMKKVSLSNNEEESNSEKKLKKLRKLQKYSMTENDGEKVPISLRKKKKQKKSVSFNDTVTKIIPVDLDTSVESEVDSTTTGDEHCDEVFLGNITSGSEEGTEHDLDLDTHKSDDEDVCKKPTLLNYVLDLSKAERKTLKMKKKLKSQNTFLENSHEGDDIMTADEFLLDCDDKTRNLKKRKCLNEFDYSIFQAECFKRDSSDKNWNKKKRGKTKD